MRREPFPPELVASLLAPDVDPASAPNEDEEIEPEIHLVIDYLTDALSPTDRLAFEELLQNDEAFRDKVEPVMLAWKYAPNYLEEAPVSDEELQRSWQELRRTMDSKAAPARKMTTTPTLASVKATRKRRVLQLLGGLTGVGAFSFYLYVVFNGNPIQMPAKWHTVMTPPPPVLPDTFTVPTGVSDGVQPQTLVLPMANFAPMSGARMHWYDRPDSTGTYNVFIDGGRTTVVIDGFKEPPPYRIVTPSATIDSVRGFFMLDSSNPAETIVDMASGHLRLTSRGGSGLTIKVRPAEKARAVFGKMPEVIK